MRLTQLIDDLLESPNRTVMLQAPEGDLRRFHPTGIASYRGYYEDLAIGYGGPGGKHSRMPTSHELAADLTDMLSAHINGYKGGSYLVTGDTVVWVSNWGECTDWRVNFVNWNATSVTVETTENL